jgi:hypothetical protein
MEKQVSEKRAVFDGHKKADHHSMVGFFRCYPQLTTCWQVLPVR